MEILEGVTRVEGMVWKLLKCLYGLNQSPRMWNQTKNKTVEEIGYVRFKASRWVHVFGEGDARVFIALYVDDLLMVWKQREVLDIAYVHSIVHSTDKLVEPQQQNEVQKLAHIL